MVQICLFDCNKVGDMLNQEGCSSREGGHSGKNNGGGGNRVVLGSHG